MAGTAGSGVYRLSLKLSVQVDIRPGSFPNVINPSANGVIPVAILTTSTSDASTVDPLSVSFGPNSATETHRKGHLQDVDGDGDFDLLLHVAVRSTGIKTGDVSASLTGKTIAGRDIEGKDNIVTVDGNNKVAGEESDALASIESAAPDRFQLLENFPNPFNPQTMIRFSLPEDTKVTLKVFNVLGQEVARLVDGGLSAGMHQVAFDATRLPSGMYLYKLEAGTSTLTKRMLLIRWSEVQMTQSSFARDVDENPPIEKNTS